MAIAADCSRISGMGKILCFGFFLSRRAVFLSKRKNAFEEDQHPATIRTEGTMRRILAFRRHRRGIFVFFPEPLADVFGTDVRAGTHEPEVSDFHESRREDMLEKTPDKLQDMEAQGPVTSTAMFPVFESYRVVFHFNDPAVGDGHFKDIRRKVFQRSGPISNGLTVDNPVGLPDFGLDGIK